jgi:radical SAM protein with 4Fe4S-binding SPASM domain
MNNLILQQYKYKLSLFRLVRSRPFKETFPKIIVLQTINRCNSSCRMCPYCDTLAKHPIVSISTERFDSVLNQLKNEKNFETLILSFQNEPLLDQNTVIYAKKFKEKFPRKNLEIVTNGVFLTPQNASEVYKYFDLVHISVNAFSEQTYKQVTKVLDYNILLKNIEYISKRKSWVKKTFLRFIRQKYNEHEQKDFAKYWNARGFKVFGFEVNSRLESVKNFGLIKPSMSIKRNIRNVLLKFSGKLLLPTCPMPFLCMYIRANGDVIQCFNDWSKTHVLGNINTNTLREIFNSEKYMKIKQNLLDSNLDSNAICRKCDVYRKGLWLTA